MLTFLLKTTTFLKKVSLETVAYYSKWILNLYHYFRFDFFIQEYTKNLNSTQKSIFNFFRCRKIHIIRLLNEMLRKRQEKKQSCSSILVA